MKCVIKLLIACEGPTCQRVHVPQALLISSASLLLATHSTMVHLSVIVMLHPNHDVISRGGRNSELTQQFHDYAIGTQSTVGKAVALIP